MKNYFSSYAEAEQEMLRIEAQEKDFQFSKKQYLAYELLKILEATNFTEIKFLGHLSDDDYYCLRRGYYFDAKTKTSDYTRVNIHQSKYISTSETPEETTCYVTRLCAKEGDVFSKLKALNKVLDIIISKQTGTVRSDIITALENAPFKPELSSIMRSVMNESEYREWKIMDERQSISDALNHSLNRGNRKKI